MDIFNTQNMVEWGFPIEVVYPNCLPIPSDPKKHYHGSIKKPDDNYEIRMWIPEFNQWVEVVNAPTSELVLSQALQLINDTKNVLEEIKILLNKL